MTNGHLLDHQWRFRDQSFKEFRSEFGLKNVISFAKTKKLEIKLKSIFFFSFSEIVATCENLNSEVRQIVIYWAISGAHMR